MMTKIKSLIPKIDLEIDSLSEFQAPTNAHQLLIEALEILEQLESREFTAEEIFEERIHLIKQEGKNNNPA